MSKTPTSLKADAFKVLGRGGGREEQHVADNPDAVSPQVLCSV